MLSPVSTAVLAPRQKRSFNIYSNEIFYWDIFRQDQLNILLYHNPTPKLQGYHFKEIRIPFPFGK
jgi:hypothetical protein